MPEIVLKKKIFFSSQFLITCTVLVLVEEQTVMVYIPGENMVLLIRNVNFLPAMVVPGETE